MARVFLLDGTALAYRSYFAFLRANLTDRHGRPTGAVHGFVATLLKLLRDEKIHPVDLRGGLLLFGVGGLATLAQLCMTRAYKRGKPIAAASLAYTAIVFASLFGMLLWDEIMPASAWLAIALIVTGAIGVSLSTRKAD